MTNPTDKLAELRALNEKRTKGPWEYLDSSDVITSPDYILADMESPDSSDTPKEILTMRTYLSDYRRNAAFIAALANSADWLLACVEALQYYANENLYYEPDAEVDGGDRARKALGGGEGDV